MIRQVEDLINRYNTMGKSVAGIVVEPIQSEGGDNHASPEFFQQLQQVAKRVSSLTLVTSSHSAQVELSLAVSSNFFIIVSHLLSILF